MWIILKEKCCVNLPTNLNESSVRCFLRLVDIFTDLVKEKKERIKMVGGGTQITGPYCKKYPPTPVRLLFCSHFIEIFHKKEDNFSLCFKLTPDPSHQIYLTVSSWEQWDQTWEFVSAAAVSLPDAPKGQTTKCLQAFRGLISISQKHPLLNSWQQQLC